MRCFLAVILLACVAAGCSGKTASVPPVGQELSAVPSVSIRRVQEGGVYSIMWNGQQFKAERRRLQDCLVFLCPTTLNVGDPGALPEGAYDISLGAPSKNEAWASFIEALQKSFPIRILPQKREMDVYVLTCPRESDGKPIPPRTLKPTLGGRHFHFPQEGAWRFECTDMEEFAAILGEHLDEIVLNETELADHYDFTTALAWYHKPDSVFAAAKQLGLDLAKARRPMDAWFVEKAPAPAPFKP